MKLNKNVVTVTKAITTVEEWQVLASPMGGDAQWKDGRSAKELARYITDAYPKMPKEIEHVLSRFSGPDADFDWKAEYVTDFAKHGYGRGMGRNHDMVIWNEDVFVGIEGKADEPFGDKTVAEELKKASDNKVLRIDKLCGLVFGDCKAKHLDLRYQLLPYIYDLAHEDMPLLRPMAMEFPEDTLCRTLTDQCMLGQHLLAAPVMTPSVTARAVYLPKGVWYDFYTGKRYTGGQYILADAPLERLPLFARAGAIIPVSVGMPQSVEDIQQIRLKVFPGKGSFVHYTDDGETLDYQQGAIHALQLKLSGRKLTQTVLQNGYPGPETLEAEWMA